MDLTRAAIEKNRITAVVLAFVLLGGWSAFLNLPRAEDPGFVIRTAQVMTFFPGASPERVEQLVTDRLEQAILEIPEVESIDSISKTGMSVVIVNVHERYKEMRPIWDALRRKVALRVCTRALRSVQKVGSLDGYLLKMADEKLAPEGQRLKRQVRKALGRTRAAAPASS